LSPHNIFFYGKLENSKGDSMATTKVATAPMRVAQVPKPGADFQIVERDIPKPSAGEVRIKVQACGVCHSDVLTKDGAWPGIQYPRVPGHEIAGIVDQVGAGVSEWKMGQRVAGKSPAKAVMKRADI
jgi:D-arabinose 1-dehydrogenase-like Zn-dependent alcohol dehydrogenase